MGEYVRCRMTENVCRLFIQGVLTAFPLPDPLYSKQVTFCYLTEQYRCMKFHFALLVHGVSGSRYWSFYINKRTGFFVSLDNDDRAVSCCSMMANLVLVCVVNRTFSVGG